MLSPGTDRGMGKQPRGRVRCRAVFLDAGGVIVLPHRGLVRAALARVGIEVDGTAVARAHYRAVRELDRGALSGVPPGYVPAFCRALGVAAGQLEPAIDAVSMLADRGRSGEILWSEPAPYALATISALRRAGIAVVVVTNSDGHAAANLRDAGICDTSAGAGAIVAGVIDSAHVRSAKPDPGIFRLALEHVGGDPAAVVHIGDTVSADVAGARAAGIVPIHLDPARRCRARDHRHIRALNGVWSHIEPRE
jgi:putative hydrolase of the HAD superfamily